MIMHMRREGAAKLSRMNGVLMRGLKMGRRCRRGRGSILLLLHVAEGGEVVIGMWIVRLVGGDGRV